ncbi:hypothetical protein EI71_00948 [Anaeroplasma bactoclasticum]|jgi:Lhr-like helicase|uniref:Uncharacterized protein n=1 Tax=Anaeroplasma bactoclasticum TaxID=2088 RepID=A0A397RWB7_9MOLU|nr:hypothetical protein [Anaeroplasma bactoclasticum]RIA75917.1 hypothetical protein EI71_00948 [Anaeroplasma bactoclasticum]
MTKNEIKEVVDMALKDADINLLSYLVSDIKSTIEFVLESTDLEFNQMADYFEDIAYMSQSKEFVEAIRTRFINMEDHSLDLKYICEQINYAEEVFPQEEY